MKINATEIRVGMIIEHKDDLWEILKTNHVKPGKGGAFAQVEMKSLNKNTKLNERFRSSETIEKTNLGLLTNKSMVNIELPLTLNKLISGHLVSGHIDTVVEIISIKTDGECLNIVIQMTEAMRPFIVQKGSITVDGVSLTVNKITDSTIDLMIIPHTFKNTTMKYYKEGQTVNIELDYIAKYIVNMSNVNDN